MKTEFFECSARSKWNGRFLLFSLHLSIVENTFLVSLKLVLVEIGTFWNLVFALYSMSAITNFSRVLELGKSLYNQNNEP